MKEQSLHIQPRHQLSQILQVVAWFFNAIEGHRLTRAARTIFTGVAGHPFVLL
jgi:hypothetical protein